ncbi:MAG: phosphotransferase [Rhodobacteraceae bacterium]|nr:phosphotransferase [Paracoccaceae bacterium]
MSDREEAIQTLLDAAGWANAARTPVAGDASNRSYERLTGSGGSTAILMNAPPELCGSVEPFLTIAAFLRSCGLSAPEILHSEQDLGLLILEDFGNDVFARIAADTPAKSPQLYDLACDVLVQLHRCDVPDVPVFSSDVMTDLACSAVDWYAFAFTDQDLTKARQDFAGHIHDLLGTLSPQPAVFIHRDYHAENLFLLPGRFGAKAVGIIDFQDAVQGHPAYDLASVLLDARRDVPADIQEHALHRYTDQTGVDASGFRADFARLGLQRNLRILGIFGRLCLRDGKTSYLKFMPRVWHHITFCLDLIGDTDLSDLITNTVPAPTPKIQDALLSKCATFPHL